MGRHTGGGEEGAVGRKVAFNTVAQAFAQIATSAIGVVLLKIMTGTLGPQRYGDYATAIAFVSAFSLITDLGLNTVTPRELAKNPERSDEIIGQNMGLRLAFCLVGIPLMYGVSYLFYPGSQHYQVRLAILVLSLFLVFDSIRQITSAHLAATMRNPVSAVITILQQTTLLILTIVVAVASSGLLGFIWAYVIAFAVGALLTVIVVFREISVRPRFSIRSWGQILHTSIAVGLLQILNLLYLRVDSLLLSLLKGTTEVGTYAIAYLLLSAFGAVPSYLMSSLVPTMVNASRERVQQILTRASQYVCLVAGLLMVGGVALRHDLVVLVASGQYDHAAAPFAILMVATLFTYMIVVFTYASVTLATHEKLVFASIASLIFNIALNLALIPRYGVVGSAIATSISEVFSLALVYRIFRVRTRLRISFGKPVLRCLAAGGIGIGATSWADYAWALPNRIEHILVLGVLGTAVYVVFSLLFGAWPAEIRRRLRLAR